MSAHLRRRLAELDAQIAEQKRILNELQRTRSDVERELHATATFPVLTLPTEITAEIFLCCIPLFHKLRIPYSQELVQPLLASVCRAWRNIAHGTPALWSELHVRFDDIPAVVASKPGLLEAHVDLLLSRAHNCPLSLQLGGQPSGAFTLDRLRGIIHRWSHRLRYINLNFGFAYVDLSAIALDLAAFPILQGATIDCPNEASPDHTIVFGNAPCLHDLCISYGVLKPGKFTFPWSQLTKFEGALVNLELFTVAHNLTEMASKFAPDHDDFTAITHLKLTSLTIIEEPEDVNIIQYLTLPALKHLDVSTMARQATVE